MVRSYNTAFPLPVIGRASADEIKAMACSATMPPLATAQWHNTVDQACCARHLPYMERPYLIMSWLHVSAPYGALLHARVTVQWQCSKAFAASSVWCPFAAAAVDIEACRLR